MRAHPPFLSVTVHAPPLFICCRYFWCGCPATTSRSAREHSAPPCVHARKQKAPACSNLRRLLQLTKAHETLSSSNSDLERRFADASATNASNANLIHALKVEYERVRMRMRVCVYA